MHVAAVWNEEERLGSVFYNGKPRGRQNVNDGKSSYRAMNNTHSVNIIGAESKNNAESGGKTLHGFIKELKVFKKALNQTEILTEARFSNASGTLECLVFLIIDFFMSYVVGGFEYQLHAMSKTKLLSRKTGRRKN